jgi:AraC-like DNA-binding protein
VPETEYELLIYKQTHIAHFEIALDYFSSLLCPSEKWSATLREKLFRGEVLYSGSGLSCYRTQKALEDVLTCPFSGAVRTLFFEAKVLEILAFQLEHYQQCSNTSSVTIRKKDRDVLEQLREYLISDFREDHSLRSLSQYFGINEFKLKKQFKEQFGQTVFDFISDLKMEHARRLLLDTGMFVKEVSREVGYKNANHFSTAFRKKFGINPAALKS